MGEIYVLYNPAKCKSRGVFPNASKRHHHTIPSVHPQTLLHCMRRPYRHPPAVFKLPQGLPHALRAPPSAEVSLRSMELPPVPEGNVLAPPTNGEKPWERVGGGGGGGGLEEYDHFVISQADG